MANLLNCLICSSAVIRDNDEERSGKRSQFQVGLQLFCKVLQVNGNYLDQLFSAGRRSHGEDAVGTGPPPCCKECWLAFEQMLRLQQAIELMQANLMEQVDKLKAALQSSVPSDYKEDPLKLPPDDILGKIRDQLLSCVRNSSTPLFLTSDHPPRKKRKQSFTKSSKQPDSVLLRKGKEHQPCSVILERLPVNFLNSVISTEVESPADIDITIKQELSTSSSSDPDGGRGGLRKSKLKAFEFIQKKSSPQKKSTPSVAIVKDDRCDFNDEEYVPSPEALSPAIQSDHDDDDEEEYPWESEAKPIPELLSNQINSSSGGTGRVSKFSLISPDTLLYQYTLIKTSQGYTHFTCQEPECPSPHFLDSPLNWNSLFSQIADHIQFTHSTSHSDFSSNEDDKLHQKCPLCPKVFPAGPQFRAHLIGTGRKQKGHRIETVVCETCWKPIRNLADAYRCHLWIHKNDQEKKELPEGLPPTLRSKVNKKLRKRGKLMEIKRSQSKATSKLKPQKKVKIKISDFGEQKYVPFPKAPSPIQDNPDDDYDEYPWESESEAKPIPEPLPNQINSSIGTGRMSKFSLISPDTLLFQYTLIKVSQGYTQFTCQEPECPSPHFSDLSLNWSSLFTQIAKHIEHVHRTPAPNDGPGGKCPLCPTTLRTDPKFRAHLVGTGKKHEGHRIETIVCEICWKPIRNVADSYRSHLWSHKSEQEKEESPEGPPPSLVSKSTKFLKKQEQMLKLTIDSEEPEVRHKQSLKMEKHKGIILKSKLKANCKDKPENKMKKQPSAKKSKGRAPQIGDYFCQILENSRESLLLYKSTLLKASYGVSLTCQESNCDHITNGTDFTAFEEFKNHVKNCHAIGKPDQVWKCPSCSEQLESGESFRCHVLYKCYTVSSFTHNGFPFICTACWKPMLSVSSLEYHQWLHKSEIEKECVLNDEERPLPTLVANKQKERESQLRCRHCQREFKFVITLKAHEATHVPKEQRKKYMCHQCPRQFLSPVALRGHVEREHQKELMRVKTCPICSKQFNWRAGYHFTTHLRSHRNERPFVCELCGKAFLNGLDLKKHKLKVHEKRERRERSWQCEFCQMNYKESKHLKRHKRNAHQDKMGVEKMLEEEQQRLKFTLPQYRPDFIGPKIAFPCPVCEKAFPLRSRMKKHWEKSCKKFKN